MFTGGNAHIIGSCDNCLYQHIVAEGGIGFSKRKKKEKLVSEKIEGRGLVCFVAFLEVKRSLSVCGLENSDFHTSGIFNLSSVTNGFKRDRKILQRTT